MPFQMTQELMDFAVSTARDAGEVIMDIYDTDFDVRSKEDESPVTEADEKAEALIRARLEDSYPDIPFIGEEAYAAGHRPDISGGLFWLVDALDGTKEFVHKRGEFTVNIALIENGSPIFGVVHAPAKERTFWGAAGQGAFAADGASAPRQIQTRTPGADGIIVVASRSHRSGEDEFLKQFTVKDTVNSGSSLKFCLVAAGEADIVNVEVLAGSGGGHTVHATVRHADEGWDHYADGFDVLAPDGTVLGTRVLAHPHVNEQPFTRSLSGVRIPPGMHAVTIRAHDSVHGHGGAEVTVTVPR